eukprot:3941316-Rhodomonas_salina.5
MQLQRQRKTADLDLVQRLEKEQIEALEQNLKNVTRALGPLTKEMFAPVQLNCCLPPGDSETPHQGPGYCSSASSCSTVLASAALPHACTGHAAPDARHKLGLGVWGQAVLTGYQQWSRLQRTRILADSELRRPERRATEQRVVGGSPASRGSQSFCQLSACNVLWQADRDSDSDSESMPPDSRSVSESAGEPLKPQADAAAPAQAAPGLRLGNLHSLLLPVPLRRQCSNNDQCESDGPVGTAAMNCPARHLTATQTLSQAESLACREHGRAAARARCIRVCAG